MMPPRLAIRAMASGLLGLAAGCVSPQPATGPHSEDMSMDQLAQTDFNRTVTLEIRDNLASLYTLLDKLYRRNPREWRKAGAADQPRSEEHTSELQSLMRISYAVFCLQKTTPSHTKITQSNQKPETHMTK